MDEMKKSLKLKFLCRLNFSEQIVTFLICHLDRNRDHKKSFYVMLHLYVHYSMFFN